MHLKDLELKNFRNFNHKTLSLSSQTTLILGPNTAGKTNILESIYLLATGKSFRAEIERETISYGEEIARVKANVFEAASHEFSHSTLSSGSEKSTALARSPSLSKNIAIRGGAVENYGVASPSLEIILTTGQVENQSTPHKKYLVNGVFKRMIDFVGNLRAVLFWPEDLELVTNSPSTRRRYLDMVLSQVDREYRRCLISYEKGLRQRNKLLERIRDEGINRNQLIFWDKLLIKNGSLLTDRRAEYINFINNFHLLFPPVGGLHLHFHLEYDKSVISEDRLIQYVREEVAAGATLVGPHRDDIKFKIKPEDTSDGDPERRTSAELSRMPRRDSSEVKGSKDLSIYGSRGEQRLAILWLKLAELEFVADKTGERPVLLLDDIFSELDHEHRQYVFKVIPQQQTIITTTDLHLIEKAYLKEIKIIEL